ncbi:dTDP-4-dehydrorhamnose reductase [Spiribacter pallidus]|uniref:dTDP-4-dehydrorhamnose reductase n=1 Tax=Spiribacter pallidus TaxID=1987936 RepID=UPI0034A01C8D
MRIALTGSGGQVGFELRRALLPVGEVIPLDRGGCDLANLDGLRAALTAARPDVIVNAAAYTAVDRAESEPALAEAINAEAPGVIGAVGRELGARVVHYSTDYVFEGTLDRPYTETDAPHPQSVYGRTKLAGEAALAATGARHWIFRTAWVIGARGHNFARTMLRLAAERDSLRVVADQIGTPTTAALIADVTAQALTRDGERPAADGIYHLTATGHTSWHGLACHVIEAARAAGHPIKAGPESVAAISTEDFPTPAPRPADSRLATDRLRQVFGVHLPDWQTALEHTLEQIL